MWEVQGCGGDASTIIKCYTGAVNTMAKRKDADDYFLNPPPGSAAARAVEFGIDLTLTLENLRLTPEERIRKLDDFIEGVAKLKATARLLGPTDALAKQDY